MKHIISVLVQNKFGVLARISGLFSARGFNIDSLAVGETDDPCISRMTIVVKGDDKILEQVTKQLRKLIETIKVQDFKKGEFVDRELVLVKLAVDSKTKPKIKRMLKKYPVRIADEGPDTMIIEIAASGEVTSDFMKALSGFKTIEMARTGKVALGKGK
ncbi:MAG: acetolactate synthase small subunit [Candidatus Omnitrophica bacterium CG1_02_49_10]|nr:MAG: acetolactate synthase small subunit [Candidatus Omnitrophica bacterium CG1_02_49_10]